jgi:hypothetical protein
MIPSKFISIHYKSTELHRPHMEDERCIGGRTLPFAASNRALDTLWIRDQVIHDMYKGLMR